MPTQKKELCTTIYIYFVSLSDFIGTKVKLQHLHWSRHLSNIYLAKSRQGCDIKYCSVKKSVSHAIWVSEKGLMTRGKKLLLSKKQTNEQTKKHFVLVYGQNILGEDDSNKKTTLTITHHARS